MNIALALSGGGHRAAAFHLGVLQFLAEKRLLENVEVISSISGGSILAAILFQPSSMQNNDALAWPSSDEFLIAHLPQAKALIVNESLENQFIKRMFRPSNWFKFGHRANLMADTIESLWGVTKRMKDLPAKPSWIINGTSNVSGNRWFVRKAVDCQMGSDDIGLTDARDFLIADAVALSAAYPGVIGPYRLDSQKLAWKYAEGFEDNQGLLQSKKGVYLSDGGLYDNLGIEPLFNLEQSSLRYPNTDFLIVSDAGSGLKRQSLAPVWRPLLRTIRLINVINQQVRALRLRSLSAFFKRNAEKGVQISMGISFEQWKKERLSSGKTIPKKLSDHPFLSSANVKLAKNTPTSLASLSHEQFERLLRHGYESALIQFSLFDRE